MAGGYECFHVPIKGTVGLMKNPWGLGIGAFVFLIVVSKVGIWPIIVIAVAMFAGLAYIIHLQMRAQNPPGIRSVRMDAASMKWCIGNHGAPATTIFRVHTNEGITEIPVCDLHLGQTENWLARQQLTRG